MKTGFVLGLFGCFLACMGGWPAIPGMVLIGVGSYKIGCYFGLDKSED